MAYQPFLSWNTLMFSWTKYQYKLSKCNNVFGVSNFIVTYLQHNWSHSLHLLVIQILSRRFSYLYQRRFLVFFALGAKAPSPSNICLTCKRELARFVHKILAQTVTNAFDRLKQLFYEATQLNRLSHGWRRRFLFCYFIYFFSLNRLNDFIK